jgi:hypothetical protein
VPVFGAANLFKKSSKRRRRRAKANDSENSRAREQSDERKHTGFFNPNEADKQLGQLTVYKSLTNPEIKLKTDNI